MPVGCQEITEDFKTQNQIKSQNIIANNHSLNICIYPSLVPSREASSPRVYHSQRRHGHHAGVAEDPMGDHTHRLVLACPLTMTENGVGLWPRPDPVVARRGISPRVDETWM